MATSLDTAQQATPIKVLLPAFLVVAVDILALTIIIPFLPFYAQSFGASPTTVGLLISSYAACQLIAGPMLGALSDRIGRRPVLIFSQLGTFAGLVLLANSHALWLVFLSRVIDGVTAGNLTVAQAYLADVTKPEERSRAFALIGISFGLGFFIGPAISGFLAHYGPTIPVYGAAGLSFLSMLGTVFLLKEPARHVETGERRLTLSRWGQYRDYFKAPNLTLYLVQFFCFTFAFSIFFSGFPLFAERRLTWQGHPFGLREVGLMYSFSGFLGILIQGRLVGQWAKKYGEPKMIVWAFVAALIGYTLLAGSYTLPLLIGASVFMALGTGVLRPAITAVISKNVDRRMQGGILGLTQSVNSVSQIIAPVLSGLLIDWGWLSAWALFAAVLSALGLLLAWRTRAPMTA